MKTTMKRQACIYRKKISGMFSSEDSMTYLGLVSTETFPLAIPFKLAF
jgi:hypothetical protein